MKEEIYTIPVNDAYAVDCECPLCHLERKLEDEAVEYTLGPAMMEPDFRMVSNDKGYCRRHFTKLFDGKQKLPLALVLDTHTEETSKKIQKLKNQAKSSLSGKSGLFKKDDLEQTRKMLADGLCEIYSSCLICDKVAKTMERYIDVLLYMWKNDEAFKAKFDKSKGVCIKHAKELIEGTKKSLPSADAKKFISELLDKEITEFERIQEDIHKFTLKFDYRNKDMEWGTAKDAPIRTIEKLAGFITDEEE